MRAPFRWIGSVLLLVALLSVTENHTRAAATVTQQVSPAEFNLGDDTIVTITIQNGVVDDMQLPTVDGLQLVGSKTASTYNLSNGSFSRAMSFIFVLSATRTGSFIIPPFDVQTQDGQILHVKPINLHVLDAGSTQVTVPSLPAASNPSQSQTNGAVANPTGPVVLPPTNSASTPAAPNSGTSAASNGSEINPPMEADGTPAKTFLIITPQTTDAYVGQSIPLEIDFFIRVESNAPQNSLPTIKGSDFLMNNFRPHQQGGTYLVDNIEYLRETWFTAISAPKDGDFPLSMQQDTYWHKTIQTPNQFGIFGNIFANRQNLAHELIDSNVLTMHIHALPTEGRPDHFTGAIGQFKVTGEASPSLVNVGEPVTLKFSVSGEGNFDYIRCPVLNADPEWKTYVPSSRTNYQNQSQTIGLKVFEQSAIPLKNGDHPLPAASFSYFDPTTKQYVTIPIPLPTITVTGSAAPIAAASPEGGSEVITAPVAPNATTFLPNRLDVGWTQTSLAPVYRHPWFWAVQTALVSLPVIGAILLFLRSRATRDDGQSERVLRRRSQEQEEAAMSDAAKRGDAVAFFISARHAVQMQLGAQWNLKPEAITLGEIRTRDSQMAETLEPFFAQADEVIYSGKASPNLDLTQWERRVRTELLQPQPA
jgi:hypothetical protein